jgi:uncharacterized protein (DUF1501 family)
MLRLGEISAMAQSSPNYKALVCVFLFGGNDANNMIIPLDAARYSAYQAMRPNIALASNVLRPVAAGGGQVPYGLHPRLANVQRLYNERKAAMVSNLLVVLCANLASTRNRSKVDPADHGGEDEDADNFKGEQVWTEEFGGGTRCPLWRWRASKDGRLPVVCAERDGKDDRKE